MEGERVCASAAGAWQPYMTYDSLAQGPLVSLVFHVAFWAAILWCYHRLQAFVQARHRVARGQTLLSDHEAHSKSEQDDIEKMVNGSTDAKAVPVSISVDNRIGVDFSVDGLSLLDAASLLRLSGAEVTHLHSHAGPVVQTKLVKLAWPCDPAKLTNQATTKKLGERVLVQLGRRQLLFRPSTENTGWRKMKLSSDDTNQVPVILHSSHSGGILTVEGVHLSHATIQAATKDKCVKLNTRCTSTGSVGLEVFTSESRLPSQDLAEVCVIASKNIISDGDNVRVSSLAVRIQNNNLRTVLRSIFPSTVLLLFATKQISGSVILVVENTNSASVLAWLLLFLIVVSALALPQRTETTITETVKQLAVRTYHTFYLAAQRFVPDRDPDSDSRGIDEISTCTSQPMLTSEEGAAGCNCPSSQFAPTPTNNSSECFEDEDEGSDSDRDEDSASDEVEEYEEESEDSEPAPNVEDVKQPQSFLDDPNWEWPVYNTVYNAHGKETLVRREPETTYNVRGPMVPFEVIHQNLKGLPWASQIVLRIYSSLLLEIIQVLLPGKVDQSAACKKQVSLDGPELFRMHEKLERYGSKPNQEAATPSDVQEQEGKSLSEEPEAASEAEQDTFESLVCSDDGKKLLHFNHLRRFMNKELEMVISMSAAMKSDSQRRVSWEMLWAFFPPGERVIYLDGETEENLCGDVMKTQYTSTHGMPVFTITVTKYDYNCKTWERYSRNLSVPAYEGEREILSLNFYPVQYTSEPEVMTDACLKRGKRFCRFSMLERSCFMNYKGSMIGYNYGDVINYKGSAIRFDSGDRMSKENADGRIMIDLGSFAKMNPDYPRLGSAKPPCEVIRDNIVKTIDITTIKTRMFAPAIVFGFSFVLKKWGSFSVSGISDIVFNMSAFDDLVMDADTKEVVENLVRKQLHHGKHVVDEARSEKVDSIASKGEGSIILCYGPPGTGKTLTAESLSEKLRCPLWCLSVSELGITPEILEKTLVKVMNVAASWGALLLIDEADIFMERRTSSDLTRNALTGVFLRQLEYYKGVLFLTTNRDSAFDSAMCSRISMFLHYQRHTEEQRRTIWTIIADRVGLQCSPDEVAELARAEFNGREIRNIVKTAHTLLRSTDDETKLEMDHVRKALKVYEASTWKWGDRDPEKPDS